jgi:hypothetical protein
LAFGGYALGVAAYKLAAMRLTNAAYSALNSAWTLRKTGQSATLVALLHNLSQSPQGQRLIMQMHIMTLAFLENPQMVNSLNPQDLSTASGLSRMLQLFAFIKKN